MTPTEAAFLSRYDAPTRRLARAGALLLLLSEVAPIVQPSGPETTLLWAWDVRPPYTLLLLGLAAVAWWVAALQPLVRRGRWLAIATAVCLFVPGGQWPTAEDTSGVLWYWQFFYPLLVGCLGLTLLRIAGDRRVGRAMCIIGGLVLLGMLWFPPGAFAWPAWFEAFRGTSADTSLAAARVAVLLWNGVGLLLVGVGLQRRRPRPSRGTVVAVIVLAAGLSVLVGLLDQVALLDGRPAPGDVVLLLLSRVAYEANYGSLMVLLGTGLFAWVVGTREKRDYASVFD